MLNRTNIALFLFSLLFISSCGNEKNDAAIDNGSDVSEFYLTGDDKMQFNLKTMVVKEGASVKVIFKNTGKMPKEIMGHNFVLLKSNVDLASFAAKALASKGTDYIPQDELGNIIAHSQLLGPGEKTTIEFEAPAEGIYKFICSFPGHYISMQGSLFVR